MPDDDAASRLAEAYEEEDDDTDAFQCNYRRIPQPAPQQQQQTAHHGPVKRGRGRRPKNPDGPVHAKRRREGRNRWMEINMLYGKFAL